MCWENGWFGIVLDLDYESLFLWGGSRKWECGSVEEQENDEVRKWCHFERGVMSGRVVLV